MPRLSDMNSAVKQSCCVAILMTLSRINASDISLRNDNQGSFKNSF